MPEGQFPLIDGANGQSPFNCESSSAKNSYAPESQESWEHWEPKCNIRHSRSCREQPGGTGNSGERTGAAWSDLTIVHDMQISIIVVWDFDHDCNWSSLRLLLTLIETSIEVDWALNWSWFRPQLKLIEPSIEVDSDLNWGWLRCQLKLIEPSVKVDSDLNWGWLSPQLKLIETSIDIDWDCNIL